MPNQNPYESPESSSSDAVDESDQLSSGKATYNVVSDTVVGLNVRKSDNKFQAIFVVSSMVILAVFVAVLAWLNSRWNLPAYGGAIIGGFAGMVIGFFASGIYLMIYRAVRHAKGQHD